jgi:membrane-associated phospholipid phosphatase
MDMIQWIQSFSNPFLDYFFKAVTMLGEEQFFIVLACLIFWCLHKELGYRLGFAFLFNGVFNIALKDIFHTARPIGHPGIRSFYLETAEGYSFPSGHTQSVASLATSFSIFFKKNWISLTGLLLTLLVAVSRLYLGVHWPVDVIVGGLLGILGVLFANWLFDYAERTQNQIVVIVPVVLILAGLWFFPNPSFAKTAGAACGFLAGYFVEPRYIGYQTQGPLWRQICKLMLGIAVLLAIRIFVKKLLPIHPLSDFTRYLIIGIWVTIIAPYLFQRIFHQYHPKSVGTE